MTSPAGDCARAVRLGAGLFALVDRGLLRVAGGDRTRWLDGMLSAEIASLDPSGPRSGCYATLLTPKGSIIADLQVLARRDEYWLETARAFLPRVHERLQRYIVADDVTLEDVSAGRAQLALEGPAAASVLEAASGVQLDLAADAWRALRIADHQIVVAAFGVCAEGAYRLLLAADEVDAVRVELERAGRGRGLIDATPEALEILRIEAGVPRLGAELKEDVLPPEARLERAISYEKGCYVGQEILARLHARGRVNHLLVGLRIDAAEPPSAGTRLRRDGRAVGKLTSACLSSRFGAIGLAYVRRESAEPGTRLDCDSVAARVSALPFAAEPETEGEATPQSQGGEPRRTTE